MPSRKLRPSGGSRPASGPAVNLGPLVKRVAYMLRRAYNVAHEQGIRAFAKHGLTPQQFGILLFLEHAPGSKQWQVAEALGVKESNMVGMMKHLVGRRLVRRGRAPRDRRVRVLELTESGTKLLRAAKRTDARLDASFDRTLGPGGRGQLLRHLRRLAGL